jgi:hypothetical protein
MNKTETPTKAILSEKDYNEFLKNCKTPPPLTKKMKDAVKLYSKNLKKG